MSYPSENEVNNNQQNSNLNSQYPNPNAPYPNQNQNAPYPSQNGNAPYPSQNRNQPYPNQSGAYSSGSGGYSKQNLYEKPMSNKNIRNQPNQSNNMPPPQNINSPPPPNYGAPLPGRGPMPMVQPIYANPPIAVPGAVPIYPRPIYPVPYGVYPYPYPYPNPGNTVVVIPPGYRRDYTGGYSPFGDIIDDLENLF